MTLRLRPDTHAPASVIKIRTKICNQCEFYISTLNVCEKCGCFLDSKKVLKNSKCPLGKW